MSVSTMLDRFNVCVCVQESHSFTDHSLILFNFLPSSFSVCIILDLTVYQSRNLLDSYSFTYKQSRPTVLDGT
jgi:hypothetical protein